MIVVSTDYLKKVVERVFHVNNVMVIKNVVPRFLWNFERKKNITEDLVKPRVIYSGSPTHYRQPIPKLNPGQNPNFPNGHPGQPGAGDEVAQGHADDADGDQRDGQDFVILRKKRHESRDEPEEALDEGEEADHGASFLQHFGNESARQLQYHREACYGAGQADQLAASLQNRQVHLVGEVHGDGCPDVAEDTGQNGHVQGAADASFRNRITVGKEALRLCVWLLGGS